MTADEALDAAQSSLERWSADALADLVTTAIGLAAMRNPLALREALSQAFNPKDARQQLEAFRAQCRMTAGQLRATHDAARDTAHLNAEVEKQVMELGQRLDALLEGLERAEARLERLEKTR